MECENICLKRGSSKSRRSCDSISILVVDDDTTCLAFVAALLKKFKYEVVTAKHPNDALSALRTKGGAFDLVVSDVHMPDMNGFQLQEAITHEFNLPVILMSVDSTEVVVSKGMKSGATLFISKPVSPNDLKDLWQFAALRKKSRVVIQDANTEQITVHNNKENSKRKAASKEGSGSECAVNTKKPKVIWTNALHYRFLEAIRSIGLERSVPKKILEMMNVPGLTRENVASHLQKYRMFLKRVSDASYKLEAGDDDEALICRSYASNYYVPSLNRSKKPQFQFDNFPASYQMAPTFHISDAPILGSINKNSDIVSALPYTHLVHQKSGNSVNFHTNELHKNINRQHLSQNELLLPPPSNLSLIQDLQVNGGIVDDLPFCSVYNLPAFDMIASHVQQPFNFNPTHDLHYNFPSHQLINIQNQQQQHGCQFTESSFFYDGMTNSSYDQADYQHVQGSVDSVVFGSAYSQFNKAVESPNECEDDGALESLLAFGLFGEEQIQTLEGI